VIAGKLNGLASPHEASFYTSGRTSNEAAFLWQLFVRQFGTNNLPDCSNMCHESSGAAMNDAIGIGKGCVTLEDFELADAIFIIGQNPGTNHPRMLSSLQSAKRSRNGKPGATVVAINPLPEAGSSRFMNPQDFKNPLRGAGALLEGGTKIADLWLPVRINGDMAFFKGMMKEMLAKEEQQPGSVFDLAFIREHTVGFDDFLADLRATSWEEILVSSGLSRPQILEAAEIAMPEVATFAELAPDGSWLAAMAIPLDLLRARLDFGPTTGVNVTMILGSPEQRFFSAAALGPGEPDFHQPQRFPQARFAPVPE
jgi:anaerobic selenocysteine-containing dehydrogenase